MDNTVTVKNNHDTRTVQLRYIVDTVCPICKAKIFPVYIASSLNTETTASVFNYCQNCHETFVTQYKLDPKQPSLNKYNSLHVIYSEPNRFKKESFNKELEELSPKFVEIYNQALAAENACLDEIAGLGYRKALEFLVKDYAISVKPNEKETIKNMNLIKCIKSYIDNQRITELAEKSAWLGNDEAHYVKKHEDYTILDMKQFIQALVYFISMDLTVLKASGIVSRN